MLYICVACMCSVYVVSWAHRSVDGSTSATKNIIIVKWVEYVMTCVMYCNVVQSLWWNATQHTQQSTDRRWERLQLSTPPAKKQAPLTTRSSSLRCVSAVENQTAEQYSKTGKTKPRLPMSNLSWNTRQDFLKIPSLWEAALETERRCFSKVN